jgi:hypothetical protein
MDDRPSIVRSFLRPGDRANLGICLRPSSTNSLWHGKRVYSGVERGSAVLERRAAASSQKLNWRTSIVDLLKLLYMDSSLTARKALATELGCPPDLMGDSAKMNIWLHKTVLARVAANGGKVPKELLD